MTNLQILLDFLDPEASAKDDAILEYFDNQNEEHFTVNGVDYTIIDFYGVREVLRDQFQDECDEFRRLNSRQFGDILEVISFSEIIDNLVADHSEEDVTSMEFLGVREGMYIYMD